MLSNFGLYIKHCEYFAVENLGLLLFFQREFLDSNLHRDFVIVSDGC